jgi:hypothetical protein
VSKFSKTGARLLHAVASAIEACWDEGSPVAGQSADRWQEIAHVAIRRIRSFDRRNIPDTDQAAQIRDIAQGFVAAFEDDSEMVGPLFVDYQYIAEKALDAVRRYEAEFA